MNNNMPTPVPADLSKLKNILRNARAIIKKDNTPMGNGNSMPAQSTRQQAPERDGYGPGGNVQYLSEQEMLQAQGNMGTQIPTQAHSMGNPTRKPGPVSESAIKNSNMPDEIKKLMLENPIAQPTINHTFNLDDVSNLIEDRPATQMMQQRQPQVRQPQRNLNEGTVIKNTNDTFTVSETALRGIIKDILVEYLAEDYTKNLTEATIKKTINTLIKEGKIKTRKK